MKLRLHPKPTIPRSHGWKPCPSPTTRATASLSFHPTQHPYLWFWLYSRKSANTPFPQPYTYLSLKTIHLANMWGVFSALELQTSKTMWISNATRSFWLEFSNLEERKQSRRHSTVCNNKTEIGKKLNVWIVRPAFQRKIRELAK